MKHPKTRAERRHHRDRVIAARRFVYLHIWNQWDDFQFMKDVSNPLIDILHVFEKYKNARFLNEYPQWGKYAKWNLNCNCRMCHYEKFDKTSAKRRIALKTADSDWEWQYTED